MENIIINSLVSTISLEILVFQILHRNLPEFPADGNKTVSTTLNSHLMLTFQECLGKIYYQHISFALRTKILKCGGESTSLVGTQLIYPTSTRQVFFSTRYTSKIEGCKVVYGVTGFQSPRVCVLSVGDRLEKMWRQKGQ